MTSRSQHGNVFFGIMDMVVGSGVNFTTGILV